ncbi:MAG: metallophosphoesterase family protein [Chitinispirillaceae bacterium]
MRDKETVIGVVSDTHGLFRPELRDLLKDSDLIIHAGDVGSTDILQQLELIAPVRAVRGNTDRSPSLYFLSETEMVQIDDYLIYVLHDLSLLDIEPSAASVSVVVFGHSHKAYIGQKNGVLYFNPGSAGPKRFRTTPGCGILRISNGEAHPVLYSLE